MVNKQSTRRDFVKELLFFSAGSFLSGANLFSLAPEAASLHLFALGDWGAQRSNRQQREVAHGMQEYANAHQIRPSALLFLGDNWYGWLWGGIKSDRWKNQYEQIYPSDVFPGPCYPVLGNHDYELRPHSKANAELNYAKSCDTRWTMPAKWYCICAPQTEPLVRILALDSNYFRDHLFYETPTLTELEVKQQLDWLQSELAKETKATFTIVMAHHPIFSNGDHGDTPALIRDWRPVFQKHLVHMYLCGHDHDLQHLEFEGDRTSYVISGGGGATLRDLRSSHSSPYGSKAAGFTHIEVSPCRMIVRHVNESGQILHTFSKNPAGDTGFSTVALGVGESEK